MLPSIFCVQSVRRRSLLKRPVIGALGASLTTCILILSPLPIAAAHAQPPRPNLSTAVSPSEPGAPTHLTVGSRTRPMGVDDPTPDFEWLVQDQNRGAVQSAYEILVSQKPTTDPADRSVIWDSGQVLAAKQACVLYAGRALASDTPYYWTVRTWSGGGLKSPFAVPSVFDTGLHDGDWQANWIRLGTDPSPAAGEQYAYLRKVVSIGSSPIVRARAYVSADQQYELWINGHPSDRGESFAYPDSQYYQTTDVGAALHPGGQNAIGLLTHWYGPGKGRPSGKPEAILRISVEHADGSREVIVTDSSWRALNAQWVEPVPLRNDTSGDREERIDGRNEPVGWSLPSYSDSSWMPVDVVGPHPISPWTHLVRQSR